MATANIGIMVKQTSTGSGSGNLTLLTNASPQSTGYQDFSAVFGTGSTTNVFYYFISNSFAQEWEQGYGHMSATQTFVRDTIIASSNSGSAVSFTSGGTLTVVCAVDDKWEKRARIGRQIAQQGGII